MDYFDSSKFALIMSWLFSIPIFLGLIAILLQIFLEKTAGEPRIWLIWIFLCFFLFSPIRYVFFQIIAANCYLWQSLSAFASIFFLIIYIPIVFGILWILGIGLPFGLLALIIGIGNKPVTSKIRLWVSALLVPVIFLIGLQLFHFALPIAAKSLFWLKAEDVIKATNGPTKFYYDHALTLYPIDFPNYASYFKEKSGDQTYGFADEFNGLRSHVASIYLNDSEEIWFIKKQYPDLYNYLLAQGMIVQR